MPFVLRLIFSGSSTGRLSKGILTVSPLELYAIGMGQPQYLCLEIPQSLSLKLIFFCPTFFSSIILIASAIESFGDFKLSKNFELNIIPGSVYA